jgi:hypothetical protein
MQYIDYAYDIPGLIGAASIIVAYLLLQMNKLKPDGAPYLLMNILGALLIIISLIFSWNLAAFIIEIFWLLISIFGLMKYLIRTKRQS